jgi:hypothetical protein
VSNNVVLFEPRNERDAKANVCDFIKTCRDKLKPFGRDIAFDDNAWDISGLGIKIDARSKKFLRFTSMVPGKKKDLPVMAEPFLSFAKALLAYTYAMRPTTGLHARLCALRYLEFALLNTTGTTCPTATTPQVLNFACQTMMASLGHGAYDYSLQLEFLYGFMSRLHLVTMPSQWKTIVPASGTHRNRVGKEFDRIRALRLPDPAALTGLAQIFNSPKISLDTLTSSVCALMLCTPDRISEVMHLPLDCIAAERKTESGGLALGLRWFPAKGAAPLIKWVIPSMADIAESAIHKLIELSRPARELALWYEKNPTKIFLPNHLEYLRYKEWLSTKELGFVLYGDKAKVGSIFDWARYNNIAKKKLGDNKVLFLFADVQTAVLKKLPQGFPIFDGKRRMLFSEALFISRYHEFDKKSAASQCIIAATEYFAIQQDIGKTKHNYNHNIFARNGITNESGEYCSLNTHAFRHYLNTMAQFGGLGENDIALWSGRKRVAQNAVYNHVSDRDIIATLRNAVGNENLAIGPIAHISGKLLVKRDEFANLKIVTAHTTGLGYCAHDFTMLPCPIHADHINCNEHVYVKGNTVHETNIRKERKETLKLLDQAKAAMMEEEYGANRWVQHQEMSLKRLEQLCAILDDPNVPQGAVFQPSGIVPASRLTQAMKQRLALTGNKSLPSKATALLETE